MRCNTSRLGASKCSSSRTFNAARLSTLARPQMCRTVLLSMSIDLPLPISMIGRSSFLFVSRYALALAIGPSVGAPVSVTRSFRPFRPYPPHTLSTELASSTTSVDATCCCLLSCCLATTARWSIPIDVESPSVLTL